MDETKETIISGRAGQFRAPANFCRAVFLQIAARVSHMRAGRQGRELAKFFSTQAELALEGEAAFALWSSFSEGPGLADSAKRDLLLAAVREIVAALEAAHETPEDWNACPRWSEWGVVKARELLRFLEGEAQP